MTLTRTRLLYQLIDLVAVLLNVTPASTFPCFAPVIPKLASIQSLFSPATSYPSSSWPSSNLRKNIFSIYMRTGSSSKRWMHEHVTDKWVKDAQKDG